MGAIGGAGVKRGWFPVIVKCGMLSARAERKSSALDSGHFSVAHVVLVRLKGVFSAPVLELLKVQSFFFFFLG